MSANALRGEATVDVGGTAVLLRPSFAALVAAEAELGSLFALVERASAGQLQLGEIATLFHHLSVSAAPDVTRAQIGEAIVEAGLTRITPALRTVLGQILQGQ